MAENNLEMTAVHGDAVGYSRLIAENEIEARNTLKTHRALIEKRVGEHSGEVANFIGDEFLCVFPEPGEGIEAAISIQRELATANSALPSDRRMSFRLGVNTGPLSKGEDGWHGEGINIAARLQALAPAGGTYISRESLDRAGNIGLQVESVGTKRLKNIPEPVAIFRIVDETHDAELAMPWRRRLPASNRVSLAISPFVTLGDESDSYFSDGMLMNLGIALTSLPGVDVLATESSKLYRGQAFSAQQIGHELGVKYVLEGATQRSGPRVRVLAQLIEVESGKTIWAKKFNSTIEDLFDAQDEIVSAVVTALDLEVIGGGPAQLHRRNVSPEVVEVIYKGLQQMTLATPESLIAASECFDKVIELSPDAPNGYNLSGFALLLRSLEAVGEQRDEITRLAEERATQALERGDVTGVSLAVLAQVRIHQKDWEGALELVNQATALRPSCDLSYGVAANVMRFLGRWEDSVEYAKQASRLSPLFSKWYETIRANAEYIGGNFSEAADIAEGVLAESDSNVEALLTLAAAQGALGHERHASATVAHAVKTRPSLTAESLKNDLPYRNEEILSDFIAKLRAAGLR